MAILRRMNVAVAGSCDEVGEHERKSRGSNAKPENLLFPAAVFRLRQPIPPYTVTEGWHGVFFIQFFCVPVDTRYKTDHLGLSMRASVKNVGSSCSAYDLK